MPWTAKTFKSRHWHDATPAQAKAAAKRATAMVKRGISDANAIPIAIHAVKHGGGKRKK